MPLLDALVEAQQSPVDVRVREAFLDLESVEVACGRDATRCGRAG
jgi:hypothetical protein